MIRFFLILFLFCSGIVFLPAGEKKVVSLSPALTELVFHLGKGGSLIGRSSVCDYPAESAKIEILGDFGEPHVEKILRLKPDLLISNDFARPEVEKIFTKAGIRVIRKQCGNLDEYASWVELLGKEFGCMDLAEKELKRIEKKLTEFQKNAQKIRKKQRVCWVIWDSPLMIAGKGSLPDSVIRYAGAENVAGSVTPEYIKASFDWLIRMQPDVIIWTCTRKLDRKHRFWKVLKAVQQNRVIFAPDSSLLQRSGPRIFDGIEQLRQQLEGLR